MDNPFQKIQKRLFGRKIPFASQAAAWGIALGVLYAWESSRAPPPPKPAQAEQFSPREMKRWNTQVKLKHPGEEKKLEAQAAALAASNKKGATKEVALQTEDS